MAIKKKNSAAAITRRHGEQEGQESWRTASEESGQSRAPAPPVTDGPPSSCCLVCILQQTSAPEHHCWHSADQCVCHTQATAAIMSIFTLCGEKVWVRPHRNFCSECPGNWHFFRFALYFVYSCINTVLLSSLLGNILILRTILPGGQFTRLLRGWYPAATLLSSSSPEYYVLCFSLMYVMRLRSFTSTISGESCKLKDIFFANGLRTCCPTTPLCQHITRIADWFTARTVTNSLTTERCALMLHFPDPNCHLLN